MSLFFSDGPCISREGDCLVAVSSLSEQIWTLGACYRRVVVNPHQKTIEIQDRTFWFAHSSRTIGFHDVMGIGYGYTDTNAGGFFSERNDRKIEDRFTVGLKLAPEGQYLELFAFTGYGGRSYDFSVFEDWDWPGRGGWRVGDQDERSRQFATLLASLVGRKVAPA